MSQDNNDFNSEFGGEHVDFTSRDLRDNPDSVTTQPSTDGVEAEYAEFVQDHPADFEQPGADPMDAPYVDAAHDADAASRASREDVDKPWHARHDHDKLTPDQLGEGIVKFATDTAYAAVGFAGLVGDKAKAFYEDQKRQYADTHPETAEREAGAKDFLNQLKEQLDKFFDDLTRGYRDMAERGRETAAKGSPFARRDAGTVPAPVVDDAVFSDGPQDRMGDDVAYAGTDTVDSASNLADGTFTDDAGETHDVTDFGRPADDFVAPLDLPDGVNNSDYTEDGEEAELDEFGNPTRRDRDRDDANDGLVEDIVEGDVPPIPPRQN